MFVGNAFGKLAGSTQVNELGEIETPILLTSTLNVPRVADAVMLHSQVFATCVCRADRPHKPDR